jgi:hypothetical protein
MVDVKATLLLKDVEFVIEMEETLVELELDELLV